MLGESHLKTFSSSQKRRSSSLSGSSKSRLHCTPAISCCCVVLCHTGARQAVSVLIMMHPPPTNDAVEYEASCLLRQNDTDPLTGWPGLPNRDVDGNLTVLCRDCAPVRSVRVGRGKPLTCNPVTYEGPRTGIIKIVFHPHNHLSLILIFGQIALAVPWTGPGDRWEFEWSVKAPGQVKAQGRRAPSSLQRAVACKQLQLQMCTPSLMDWRSSNGGQVGWEGTTIAVLAGCWPQETSKGTQPAF